MKNRMRAGMAVVVSVLAVNGCDDSSSTQPQPCTHCVAAIAPEQDNTIYDGSPSIDLSAGDFGHLFSGWTREDSPRGQHASLERRALIRFEVAGFLPAGATVDSVVLNLTVTRSFPGARPRWFKLLRLTASWGEGASAPSNNGGGGTQAQPPDATWRHWFYPDTLWSRAGGDFAAAPSGSSLVAAPGRRYQWRGWTRMTDDVQSWLDDAEENFGWIIVGEVPVDPAVEPTTRRFASRENQEVATRPTLQVHYTKP